MQKTPLPIPLSQLPAAWQQLGKQVHQQGIKNVLMQPIKAYQAKVAAQEQDFNAIDNALNQAVQGWWQGTDNMPKAAPAPNLPALATTQKPAPAPSQMPALKPVQAVPQEMPNLPGVFKNGTSYSDNPNQPLQSKGGLSIIPSMPTEQTLPPLKLDTTQGQANYRVSQNPISDQQLQSLIGLATQEVNAGEVGKRNAQEGAQRVLSELLGYNTSTRGQDLNAQEGANALNQRAKEQGYQASMQQLQALMQGQDNQAMRSNQLYDMQTQRVKALQDTLPKAPEYALQTVTDANGGQQLFAVNKSNPSDFQQVGAKGQAADDAIFFEKANAMLAMAEQNPQLKSEPEFQAMMQERARRIAQNKSK